VIEQGALFRTSDPDTSRQAAASVDGAAVEELVLEAFLQFGALTDDELVDVLDGPYGPTVKTARSRLHKAGCLKDSGMRRPSNRGRQMIVWTTNDS
jgi:HrpA-like RNA helicase